MGLFIKGKMLSIGSESNLIQSMGKMGMVKTATSGGIFKRAFNEALMGAHCVTLFDHGWATLHGSGYHSSVYKYSVAAGFAPMEFEGRQVDESTLVKHICQHSPQSNPDLSSYRRISAAMEERNSGLIIIHNAHSLSDKATHLLARLITFLRREKLDWKIILFADTKSLNDLNFAQLAVEKSFPESFLKRNWKSDKSADIKRKNAKFGGTGESIKVAIGATLGLLVLAIGFKLFY